MEPKLKAFLLRSVKKPKNFIQYFPLNSGDVLKNQLIIISNRIKEYGNGYLQNKDLVYYYRTFTLTESNITIFCIFYFHFSLNRQFLINLADEICNISDNNNLFDINSNINENVILKINELYYKYISIIKKDKGIYGIELIGNTVEENNDDIKKDSDSIQGVKFKSKAFSRIKEKDNKTNSDLGSTFNNAPFIEYELTFMMRGYNLNKIIKVIKWKKFKKCWLIIFIILCILIYGFLGLYCYFWIYKDTFN